MAKRQSQLDKVIAVLEGEIAAKEAALAADRHALNKLRAEQTKAAARKVKERTEEGAQPMPSMRRETVGTGA